VFAGQSEEDERSPRISVPGLTVAIVVGVDLVFGRLGLLLLLGLWGFFGLLG
jgi:hypothetical protein